ncbi:MAG TPA: type IX secretion system membrane protein PorP/SprF [Crocinitomix sp.]|nr:type IX secretion system membrane protein PorP/SprF [Crocinitomix sp.]
MRIPRDFDRWMFDYKEGNLSQTEIDYFEQFMSDNPQFDLDVEAWDNAYVKNHQMSYPHIESLIKQKTNGKWLGWVAVLTLLLMSAIGIYFFNPENANYSPRTSVYSDDFKEKNTLSQSVLLSQNQLPKIKQTITNQAPYNAIYAKGFANQVVYTEISTSNNDKLERINTQSKKDDFNTTSSKSLNHKKQNVKTNNRKDRLIDIELSKLIVNKKANTATYLSNPNFSETELNIGKIKKRHRSVAYKMKRLYRKIERMTGYPIGLINLHDPEILTTNPNILSNNFAFTGSFGSHRFEAKQRFQWLGENQASEISSVSFDTYSKSLKSGIGVQLNRNSYYQGTFADYNVNFIYSPKFQIGRKLFFEPAIKLTLGMMRVDQAKMTPNTNHYEIERGRIVNVSSIVSDNASANNMWYKDFGLGFVLNAEKFYVGFNVDNIGRHNEIIYGNNETAPLKINAILGSDYQSKNKTMVLSPFVTYNQIESFKELWGGVNLRYYWLTVGGAYSTKGDYSASIGLKLRNFKLIYQYDKSISFINNNRFASHNIGIRINAKQKQQR